MFYQSETQKIRPMVEQYCRGIVLDVGCGHDRICPEAIALDHRPHEAVSVVIGAYENLTAEFPELIGRVDAVFSSHLLNMLALDSVCLRDWFKFLKIGGYLVLYLPDYDVFKPGEEHVPARPYTYATFYPWFKKLFGKEVEIVRHGQHVGQDLYSFYIVARRIA
jgi:predicted SAM-dependent methyltransferase